MDQWDPKTCGRGQILKGRCVGKILFAQILPLDLTHVGDVGWPERAQDR